MAGTVAESDVVVADATGRAVEATAKASLAGFKLKLVPVTLIGTLAGAIVGENDVIVGEPGVDVTVKEDELVTAVPPDTEILIVPLVAEVGTVAVKSVLEAEVTVPVTPLNWMAFWLTVELNPEPRIVTAVPTGPLDGEKVAMVT